MGTESWGAASKRLSPTRPGAVMPPPDEPTDAVAAMLADAPQIPMPADVARRLQAAIAREATLRNPPKGNPTETTTPLKRDTPLWSEERSTSDR